MNGFFANLPLLIGMPEGAAASGGGGGQLVSLLITFGLIIVIFYFLIIRPQSKKQKETKNMLSQLKKGDRIVTAGGMRGSIHSLKEDTVVVKVDDNTKLEFNRSAISSVINPERAAPKPKQSKEKAEEAKSPEADEDSGESTDA